MFLKRLLYISVILIFTVSLDLFAADSGKTEMLYTDAMKQGVVYARQGDNARALARFKEAVRLMPRSAEANTRLALTYCDRGMYMAAEQNARKATLLDDKFAFGWLVLGTAQFYGDKEEDSIESLNKALRLDPKNPHITYTIGRSYYYMGTSDDEIRRNKSKALEYFKQTLRLSPVYVEARFMEGCCFLDLDMPDVARDSFLTALRADSDNPEIFFRLGICAIKTGRFVEAERRLRETLRRAPQHYDANLYLADLFMQNLPDKEQAILYYKRFLESAPHDHSERARVMEILDEKDK